MPTMEQAVHDALMDRIEASDFPLVTFDGGRMFLGDPVRAGTIVASPIGAEWSTPSRNRQTRRLERASWPWELILKFDRRVSLQAFEASMEDDPPIVTRAETGTDQQVTLLVARARYVHPPHNQPSTGTEVVYAINAELSPV
jgi:hypothetical protein